MLVGRRHSHAATKQLTMAGAQFQGGVASHRAASELPAIIAVASCLARRGTARLLRQSRTMGPNTRWASSQSSRRLLPREKQNAARSTNGTVGNRGRKMPTSPAARHANPTTSQSSRFHAVCDRVSSSMATMIGVGAIPLGIKSIDSSSSDPDRAERRIKGCREYLSATTRRCAEGSLPMPLRAQAPLVFHAGREFELGRHARVSNESCGARSQSMRLAVRDSAKSPQTVRSAPRPTGVSGLLRVSHPVDHLHRAPPRATLEHKHVSSAPRGACMTSSRLMTRMRKLPERCKPRKTPETRRLHRVKPAGSARTATEAHTLLRANSGFTIRQLVAEYRALRACVLRL